MPQLYWKAHEAEEIAEQYMKYHPDLVGAHIGFVFKEKATKSDGKPVIGRAYKVPQKYRPLMEEQDNGDQGYDFMILIGADAWSELSQKNKEAHIDHMLECCYGEEDSKGEIKWRTRKPEIKAFPVILSRHGVNWESGVNKLSVLNLNNDTSATKPKVRNTSESNTESDVSVNS